VGAPPAVVHVRDCLPPGRVSSFFQRSIRRRSGAVVANSRYTLERFGCADGGFVVHNAVDPDRFNPRTATREAARTDLGIEPGRPVLGVVAQLTPWKGQDVAIHALIRVRETYPDAILLLAGAAKFTAAATRHDNLTYVDGLHELVRSAGLEGSVRFLGERADVPLILAALDLVLLPSWEEPFGRAVIEAFAMGVPVIATDVGGTAEVITEGADGLLRPPRDPEVWAEAIVSLLGRPDVMRAMGDRARDTALRRFTPDDHGQAVAAVYEHVVGERAPARRDRPIFV
jgi:L-malate glycosyltransferase